MKYTFLICSLLLVSSLTVSASEKELVKSCSTVLTMPEETKKVETQIDIYKINSSLTATVTQKSDGQSGSYDDDVQVEELQVQAGLTPDDINEKIDDLNLAERLIVHALSLTEDPVFKNTFNAGLELRKVRSAKIYTIGKPTSMGLTAIVEAKDESGKNLGSFLGGFLVSGCK
jgi:hypothetical protein